MNVYEEIAESLMVSLGSELHEESFVYGRQRNALSWWLRW